MGYPEPDESCVRKLASSASEGLRLQRQEQLVVTRMSVPCPVTVRWDTSAQLCFVGRYENYAHSIPWKSRGDLIAWNRNWDRAWRRAFLDFYNYSHRKAFSFTTELPLLKSWDCSSKFRLPMSNSILSSRHQECCEMDFCVDYLMKSTC